ncbi:Transcription factor spt8, partial [Phlyctochytrium bullatum]
AGNINLYTVRHDEGHCQHVLRGHKRPVSLLLIDALETGLVSGSWDKSVKVRFIPVRPQTHHLQYWDLNTGDCTVEFTGLNSQVTSAAFQPMSSGSLGSDGMDIDLPGPRYAPAPNSVLMVTSFDGVVNFYDRRAGGESIRKVVPSGVPPWSLSVRVDEFDFGEGKLTRNLKLPRDSGPVYQVAAMPNSRHLICASYDNIRLYDLQHSENQPNDLLQEPPDPFAPVSVPFTIVPGHHGGVISTF